MIDLVMGLIIGQSDLAEWLFEDAEEQGVSLVGLGVGC